MDYSWLTIPIHTRERFTTTIGRPPFDENDYTKNIYLSHDGFHVREYKYFLVERNPQSTTGNKVFHYVWIRLTEQEEKNLDALLADLVRDKN